jgi:hypothetical protein
MIEVLGTPVNVENISFNLALIIGIATLWLELKSTIRQQRSDDHERAKMIETTLGSFAKSVSDQASALSQMNTTLQMSVLSRPHNIDDTQPKRPLEVLKS